jgi:3-methyladenine DNA glycosylase AlkC
MAERLKDQFFTRKSNNLLADSIRAVYPAFDKPRFLGLIYDQDWDSLELKAKMHRVTLSLGETLPHDFILALAILKEVVPQIGGFDAMVFPDFVEIFGLGNWTVALPALAYFTQYASAEFAIRPFLNQDPERTLPYLLSWADDPNPNVRRLASEGSRPRLPWAMALSKFKSDPTPILPILEKLKDDETETVRRSVANNLNDISKDHPTLTLAICEAWYGHSKRTDWIVKHACRGLLKAGNKRALTLFGFAETKNLKVSDLKFSKGIVKVGEDIDFSYLLHVGGNKACKVRIEYGLYFVKARGEKSRKIFQIAEREYQPGSYPLKKRHSMVDRSTRKHYPGVHDLTIIVNGSEKAGASFELVAG